MANIILSTTAHCDFVVEMSFAKTDNIRINERILQNLLVVRPEQIRDPLIELYALVCLCQLPMFVLVYVCVVRIRLSVCARCFSSISSREIVGITSRF